MENNKNNNKEIIEVKTNEIKEYTNETTRINEFNNNFDMQPLLHTAGTLIITEEQKKILQAPVPEEKIEIRPDGLVYLPWSFYQDRLDKAFGLSWSLVPQGMPKYDKYSNQVLWGFYLIINGKFIDFSIGQQEYIAKNPTMSYGDAIEGAKSNALMRCCKRLGVGLELWDKEFVENWKKKYAKYVYDEKRKRYVWYKVIEKKEEKNKEEIKKNASIVKDVDLTIDTIIEKKVNKNGQEFYSIKIKNPQLQLYLFDTKLFEKINSNDIVDIYYVTEERAGKEWKLIIDIVEKEVENGKQQ